jgi:serine/threonine protein kinase
MKTIAPLHKPMAARKVTRLWLAPECSACMPRFESDVYSLAMCIFEAFVGHPPYFTVSDEGEVKDKVLVGELPRRPNGMTDKVWLLIERMTTMDWKKRIPLSDVIQFLGELANSELAPFIREDESDR